MPAQPRHYATARGSYVGEVAAAGRDYVNSFRQTALWHAMAFNDILTRYRGSILGPFWITLTSAAFALGIGLVYSEIMRVPAERYLPWITTGVVVWNLFQVTVVEGSTALVSESVIIRQSATPLPLFIWRVIWRNIINFAHQFVVVIAVALYFGYFLKIDFPLAALGLTLFILNVSWVCFIGAVLSARYRDIQQVILTVMQILFFLSPVIWIPGENRSVNPLLLSNPMYHMLEVTRNPLLGLPAPLMSFVFLALAAVVGWAVTFLFYAAVRRRIVHYL